MDHSPLTIRPLTVADLDVQQRLVESAGWNQLRGDLDRLWRYQPRGCFAAIVDERPVATITTTSYGTGLAWIGMMLVDPGFRRRGIATALMQQARTWLQQQGAGCIKLDATPEGVPVYSQLGFHAETGLHRYARPASGAATAVLLSAGVPFTVPELDSEAFGTDRSDWLRRLAADSRVEVVPGGYGMLRPGRLAAYLGPVVARDPASARTLVERLLDGVGGAVFWDLHDQNPAAVELAEALGFRPVRTLTRMWVGDQLVTGRLELQYGLSDFATG